MLSEVQSLSTKELFEQAEKHLAMLRRLMLARKNRDRACMTLTDLYVRIEALGQRIQTVEFTGGPVARDDEEESVPEETLPMAMAELLHGSGHAEVARLDAAMRTSVLDFVESYEALSDVRLLLFGQLIDYLGAGCETPEEVTRKYLAIARRVRPQVLSKLGLSQVDVSRRLDEQRATVQAREKRLVEKPLIKAGARGYSLLGGQKSQQHRAACKKAQKGNNNRSSAKAKRAAVDCGIPQSNSISVNGKNQH